MWPLSRKKRTNGGHCPPYGLLHRMVVAHLAGQRLRDQRILLGDMGVVMTAGRRGRTRAAGVVQAVIGSDAGLQVMADLEPCALVHRLFLAPDHFARLRIAREL